MSAKTPGQYRELEDAFITDANFKVDISQKMKVPNKISFNNDSVNAINANNWHENMNMHVPERILVIGRDQHIGTRAPPREIVFDNSLLQQHEPYPSDPRIGTPPRSLTLDKYPFPGIEEFGELVNEEIPSVESLKHMMPYKVGSVIKEKQIIKHESTPPIGAGGEGLKPAEEPLLNNRLTLWFM
ncbi:Mitochondrial and peroxisomal fission factor Mff [Popillia japonica]|uniref:Mitochondrial and peroxisomal fission factor Mff n=1 Tax=Popillia japonica TaxID=7064 RepID=A0AAW1L3W0_POPJA